MRNRADLHLFRHGQAVHNLAARERGHAAYESWDFEDARWVSRLWSVAAATTDCQHLRVVCVAGPSFTAVLAPGSCVPCVWLLRLDDVGMAQAAGLGGHARKTLLAAGLADASQARLFDVVFVSPLTRTLQTATLAFPKERLVALEIVREAFGGYPVRVSGAGRSAHLQGHCLWSRRLGGLVQQCPGSRVWDAWRRRLHAV